MNDWSPFPAFLIAVEQQTYLNFKWIRRSEQKRGSASLFLWFYFFDFAWLRRMHACPERKEPMVRTGGRWPWFRGLN